MREPIKDFPDPQYPLTLEGWIEWAKAKKEAGEDDLYLGPVACRHYLAACLGKVYEAVHVMLFQDELVKNYVVLSFGDPNYPQFAYDVCFRRKDGHYPSDKPLLDAYLELRVEELEVENARLRAQIEGCE